jgi:hypothetical protein
MQYGSAREFYTLVVRRIENSDFDEKVMEDCRERAEDKGYHLYIRQYENNRRDASVMLTYDYTFPVTQKTKTYTIRGYAR